MDLIWTVYILSITFRKGHLKMNSADLVKRICDCLSDGYDDEEFRKETENESINKNRH